MKKLLPLLIVLFSLPNHSFSEDYLHIDSLLTILKSAKDDTNKVNLYGRLINYYTKVNYDSALVLCAPALQLAEKLKWDEGTAYMKFLAGQANWRKGNFDKALKYHFESLAYYRSIEDKDKCILLLTCIAHDYADGGKYSDALKYLDQVDVLIKQSGDKKALAGNYLLYAWIQGSMGNNSESIKTNYKALKIYEEVHDNYGMAIALSNIADGFTSLGNYSEALKYYQKCIKPLQEAEDKINLASNYINMANVYRLMGSINQALNHLDTAYNIAKGIHNEYQMASVMQTKGDIYLQQTNFNKAIEHFINAADLYKNVSKNQDLASVFSSVGYCYTRLGNYSEAAKSFDKANLLLKDMNSNVPLANYYEGVEVLDSATGNWRNAYFHYKNYIVIRDSTSSRENTKKILQQQIEYENEKKEALAKAEQEKKDAVTQAEIKKQKVIRNSVTGGLAAVILFSLVIYRQRNRISKEKKRSDELLLNILPSEVASELKEKGSADAKHFDQVTVMFTDFKGFTKIAENLTPVELVSEIHECFKAFDNIIGKYGIEKIKTIGDAYMCAGGLPVANKTHADDVVNAALEIQQFMQQHLAERKNSGKEIFEIRIGIHTGPVVAGIVGIKKFAYDIWGDTVNIASRMESSGEAGKVNISGATYELVKEKFKCEHRGKVSAKNKGEIEMYYVEQKN
jgi:class 3 adenylate cyclase/predicted negative regulator of RcsB-dependent stress response